MSSKSNSCVLTSDSGCRRSPGTKPNSKFFFSETAISNTPCSKSKKGKSSDGSEIFATLQASKISYDLDAGGKHEGIFGLPHENKTEGITFRGSSVLNLDHNINPIIADHTEENQVSHNHKTVTQAQKSVKEESVLSLIPAMRQTEQFSIEEAEEYLKSNDIDKIFENYNTEAAQLLTAGFEHISTPYDKALKLNREIQEFQEKAQEDILKLGKRKRDSSEAVDLLRTRITILESSNSKTYEEMKEIQKQKE